MKQKTVHGQEGFVIVWSLLIIVVLTLLGTYGISTSIFESKMAANSALHKQAFYQADGGTEVGLDMLRQNINCISGFKATSFPADASGNGGIYLIPGKENFWVNNFIPAGIGAASDNDVLNERDFYYPPTAGQPHTNVRINGLTEKNLGSAQIGLGGYESLGTNIAQGGAGLVYQINAQYAGRRNTESAICTKYRVDSQFANSPAGDCFY